MRIVAALAAVLMTALAAFAGWGWCNRPVPVGLSFDEPFASVSFAPFRRGESPLTHDYPTPAEIDSDLASLQGVARGVRTYTAREGLDLVPEIAGKYGLEVTHSAWLGTKLDTNELEIQALIKAANQHPDTIKRVIVGNEVLLRKDLTPQQLIGYIRRVKAAVKQPVSYADVWAFWLKHPELANEVDYITVHILPYWEDEPIGVDQAADHLVETYRLVQRAFPGKPILIGESGWPTRGRDRGPASATIANGARFVRTLAKVAKENGFDYNVVEAFDQPWKSLMEGTVGANWGVVDGHRHVKYRMSGPVEENPGWPAQGGAAVLMGAVGALWLLQRRWPLEPGRSLALAVLAQSLATLTVWQAVNAWWLGYDFLGDAMGLLRIALHASLAWAILRAAGAEAGGSHLYSRWGERLVPLYGMAAVAASVLLLLHGRYRDIPNLEFLVPCLGIAAYGLLRRWLGQSWTEAFAVGRLFAGDRPGRFGPAKSLTVGLWLSALAAPLSEALALAQGDDFIAMHPHFSDQLPLLLGITVANHEMLVWSAMTLVLSLPFWAEWRLNDPTAES